MNKAIELPKSLSSQTYIEIRSTPLSFAGGVENYRMTTTIHRHRFSKEIAEELLLDEGGDGAYFYCIERLARDTEHPQLWRDVLIWLDELKGESNG
jgi:hypothetical protein